MLLTKTATLDFCIIDVGVLPWHLLWLLWFIGLRLLLWHLLWLLWFIGFGRLPWHLLWLLWLLGGIESWCSNGVLSLSASLSQLIPNFAI